MTPSPAHSDAARHNGAQSQGPVTAEGKARSSQNARKHNLLGSTRLLAGEDREEYDAIAASFLDEYRPATATEQFFVFEMIDAVFRLQRVRAFSASIQEARMAAISDTPDLDVAAQAFDQLANEGPSLTLLLRYENQFRRQFDKSLESLLAHRRRAAAEKQAQKKAASSDFAKALHNYVMGPIPGQPQTPKSNTVNFPNEPSTDPAREAARDAIKAWRANR